VETGLTPAIEQEEGKELRQAAGLILMYHRIGVFECDPWGLAVSPERFAEHLELLRKFGQPRPLTQTAYALRHNELFERTLVLTFDDGYVDNLNNAAPLFERYDAPATIFLASGYIGSAREFWWDELERMLLGPVRLPGELRVTASGRLCIWSLGEACEYTDDERRSDRAWGLDKRGALSKRGEFYRAVHRVLQPLDDVMRLKALDDISVWSGDAGSARPSHLCVSPDEAVALKSSDLIELGAHTVTHRVLSGLPEEAQRQEIRQSKADLERLLGTPVLNFAYPYGQYSERTAALVREEGFVSACSTQAGVLTEDSDLFALPRVKIGDWDAKRFEATLAQWLPMEPRLHVSFAS
jgi:peptidoglycan/xylan/chitin deacetylase (PgdA/CDA1 family)